MLLSDPAPGRTSDPAPARTSHPAPARTTDPAPAHTSHPAPAHTTDPAPARTSHPAPARTTDPTSGRTVRTCRVGSHTRTAGGLARAALPYADATGAEAVQVYVSNSRGWALPPGDPEQDTLFRDGCGERGIPAYVHASLLVNLGSPTPATVQRSVATLEHALLRGAAIGAAAVVFHAGSSVDPAHHDDAALRQVGAALLPLLDRAAAAGLPRLLVEPSAGGGRSLAAAMADLGPYLAAVERHPWLGVCFDTCHAWAAGHDLATPGGMTATLDALVAAAGPGRLSLVHANDSKDDRGSARDRHETIGAGRIGAVAFGELFAHPAVAGLPVIVETPTEGHAGHAADIALLKSLRC